jgi:hypothetical protein
VEDQGHPLGQEGDPVPEVGEGQEEEEGGEGEAKGLGKPL